MITRTRAGTSLRAVALIGAVGATPAWARDDFSIDVSVGASAATNPFLEVGDDTEAASGFVEVSPLLTMQDEVSTVSVRGVARLEQYSRSRYSSEQSGELELNVSRQQSDQLSLRAGAMIRSEKGTARDVLAGRVLSLDPLPGLPQQFGDLSFIGRRTRTTTASARVGASYRLSGVNTLDGDLLAGVYRFKDPVLSDYRFANQEFGITHVLSERTSLRATLGLGEVDYARGKAGDSLIVTPMAGIVQQLSERTQLSVSAGPTFTRIRRADGSRDTRTGFAVRGNLCTDQVRGRLCLNIDRSSQPTALGDVRTLTNVAVSGSRQFNSRDTLQLAANATRTGGDATGFALRDRGWFVGASAELSRKFSPRLGGFARASFADVYDQPISRRADFRGEIGVRFRFGAIR